MDRTTHSEVQLECAFALGTIQTGSVAIHVETVWFRHRSSDTPTASSVCHPPKTRYKRIPRS